MNQQQQVGIVIECHRLALELKSNCIAWLHTATDKRQEKAGFELAASADALYTLLNNHPEIMGSDTGKPAFDEPINPDFQEDMQSLWEQPEPDIRERRRK